MKSVKLIIQAIKERNLPLPVAVMLAAAAGYVVFPIDIIPDAAFPVGVVDDLLILGVMIGVGGRILTDKKLTDQNRAKSDAEDVVDL